MASSSSAGKGGGSSKTPHGGGGSSSTPYGDGGSSSTPYGGGGSSYGGGGSSSFSPGGGSSSYSSFSGGCSPPSLSPPQDVSESIVKLTLTAKGEVKEYNAAADKTVVLLTSDGVEFKVRIAVASFCTIIRRLIDEGAEGRFPLDNVDSSILPKVLEYCNKHAEWSARPTPLKLWDAEYVKALVADLDLLRRVLLAAHFLEIDGLLQLLTQAVADLIKRKSPEEIRQTFKIKKDFTPEQEEEVKKRYGWAVEEE